MNLKTQFNGYWGLARQLFIKILHHISKGPLGKEINSKKIFKRPWYLALVCFDLIALVNNKKGSNSIILSSLIIFAAVITDISLSLGPYFSTIIDMDRVGYAAKMTCNYLSSPCKNVIKINI